MNILIITDSYPPEIKSAPHLMQELAEELVTRGYSVKVVTSYPQYNLANNKQNKTFNVYSQENGVEVIRVKTLPHHNVNFLIRGISELLLPYLYYWHVRKFIQKVDVVISYSPPLTLGITSLKVKKRYKAKFIVNLQDIFPQNAIDIGKINNPFLVKFYEGIERIIYTNADKITTHSKSVTRFIIEKKRVSSKKVVTLHNWIDFHSFENLNKNLSFKKTYGLENKFIILFAGVIGCCQGLGLIIDIAKSIKRFEDIVFLIVGDGTEKKKLQEQVKRESLKNIIFKDFVSKEDYPYLAKSVDVGLVCLHPDNKTPIVPGKILGYMAASIPVIAYVNKESDAHELIKDAQCGYSIISDDPNSMADTIVKMYKGRDRLKEYGKNGFIYASEHFSKEVCTDNLVKLF